MKRLATWKSLRQEYSPRQIIDAFFGGFVFAILIIAPVILALVEFIMVYMYLLTLSVILIIIALFAFVALLHWFWRKSLLLKKADASTDIRKLFTKTTLITCAVILVLGLVFIFVMIPILWV
ncbi:MAG: hypothetical protein JXB08_01590 [Bacilli bacterium]|nr:hypothetical protein [Bacilli bacterium]MBN2876103.1 hypothetical protein [Bacilli bacterium]